MLLVFYVVLFYSVILLCDTVTCPGIICWDLLLCSALLIVGGFGVRGVAGMVAAAQYAREHKVPFLGVCLGMQVMVIEYSPSLPRHVLGLDKAHSAEFDEAGPQPVVIFMPEINQLQMGGTMRLGARATNISILANNTAKVFPNAQDCAGVSAGGPGKGVGLSSAVPASPPAALHIVQPSASGSAAGKSNNGKKKKDKANEAATSSSVTLAAEVYGLGSDNGSGNMPELASVMERHRHRYEVNPRK